MIELFRVIFRRVEVGGMLVCVSCLVFVTLANFCRVISGCQSSGLRLRLRVWRRDVICLIVCKLAQKVRA